MPRKPLVVFSDVPVTIRMEQHFRDVVELADVLHTGVSSRESIEKAREDAIVWISRVRPVTRADLERMPAVRLLSAWGIGYNHIDTAAATDRGIPVCVNPFFSRSVAEAALALILALSKRLPQLIRDARSGREPAQEERGIEIRGKTLGIVGYGRIGRELGELANRLEMGVVACDPYAPADSVPAWCRLAGLDELLSSADFVVLAAPLTAETTHMIGSDQLDLMKRSAYLINVGRGALMKEDALLTALQTGRIAGAGLDVWEAEPVAAEHPLLALDNVIGTPHRLAATHESLAQVCRGIAANALRALRGEAPLNVVNPEALKKRHGGNQ